MTPGVMVASAGDLAAALKRGDALSLLALSPGVTYPICFARVLATGAAATSIKGLISC